jgi:tripartite-type tricarboxylate transporter receptor subunit TctC
VQPQVASGKLKGIAVTTARRVSVLPNVPTIQESGIRDFDIAGWLGLMVPAGTPTPVVNRLQRAIGEALRVGEVRTRFKRHWRRGHWRHACAIRRATARGFGAGAR